MLDSKNRLYYNKGIMRILVVEDEKDLRNIINGEEALDYMEMTSYDGVLLDIMLPGKDGFAVLKEVRQMGNDTPILLLTARDGIEDRVKGLDLGADDYLIKHSRLKSYSQESA